MLGSLKEGRLCQRLVLIVRQLSLNVVRFAEMDINLLIFLPPFIPPSLLNLCHLPPTFYLPLSPSLPSPLCSCDWVHTAIHHSL